MRLWSLHPRYLDSKGLVALWREGLLAQKVIYGGTRGYRNHPQLERFREHPDPRAAIASYLHAVCDEALGRGYNFDRRKINDSTSNTQPIEVSDVQLVYEASHLSKKLQKRDPGRIKNLPIDGAPEPHPSFVATEGPIAPWERV